ncbi:MAG: heme ABC exporter ATP-binding protein CcmA [Rhizobiales bacterium]|nr:heme ABC exporter ATP-binding protein CcmA [Hyphomicrobiales bacterium]
MRLIAAGLGARRGGREVFTGLSFAVAGGELMAVTGPNGAGKSTLLRVIAGLLAPVAGAVTLDPAPSDGIGTECHYVGHADALKPALTVAANLKFWRSVLSGKGSIDEALDAVGIARLADLPVATLSAGQKRRAALARLLVAPRRLWLLDEPTGALDTAAEAMLGRLLTKHLVAGGIAIAATHRPLPVTAAQRLALGAAG